MYLVPSVREPDRLGNTVGDVKFGLSQKAKTKGLD